MDKNKLNEKFIFNYLFIVLTCHKCECVEILFYAIRRQITNNRKSPKETKYCKQNV